MTFPVREVTSGVTLGGDPESHFLVTFEWLYFFGVSGLLGGQHFVNLWLMDSRIEVMHVCTNMLALPEFRGPNRSFGLGSSKLDVQPKLHLWAASLTPETFRWPPIRHVCDVRSLARESHDACLNDQSISAKCRSHNHRAQRVYGPRNLEVLLIKKGTNFARQDMSCLYEAKIYMPMLWDEVPHTHTHTHLEGSFVYMFFPSFPLKTSLFVYTKPLFRLLTHLSFKSWKHLWCILFPSDV